MWNFFNTDSHKKAIGKTPGYRFSGGRGESVSQAIQIYPKDIQHLRKVFSERLENDTSGKYKLIRDPQMLDLTLGQWAKEKYLRERFGKKGKDWTLGPSTKTDTAIQAIVICPIKGEPITLYFDLSEFYPKHALRGVTHEEAIQRMPGAHFSGGRGESVKDSIKITLKDLKHFQDGFQKAMKSTLPEDAAQATEIVNGMIGEVTKMQYLEERFGKKDHDWFCGDRAYLEDTIQSQEIKLADGQCVTLFFDFSAIHGPFTRKEASVNPPTIYIDKNALAYELLLVGRYTTVRIHAQIFGILVLTAHSKGWRGGSHLLKTIDGQVALRDFDTATLDEEEARTFGETLSQSMQVDLETIESEELQSLPNLLELCKDGGFKIQIQTPTDN
jgi:hypothetical protein